MAIGFNARLPVKDKPIPEPSEELKAQCNADDQLGNFERVFRSVMSAPKAEVLKREVKGKTPQRTEASEEKEGLSSRLHE